MRCSTMQNGHVMQSGSANELVMQTPPWGSALLSLMGYLFNGSVAVYIEVPSPVWMKAATKSNTAMAFVLLIGTH